MVIFHDLFFLQTCNCFIYKPLVLKILELFRKVKNTTLENYNSGERLVPHYRDKNQSLEMLYQKICLLLSI